MVDAVISGHEELSAVLNRDSTVKRSVKIVGELQDKNPNGGR